MKKPLLVIIEIKSNLPAERERLNRRLEPVIFAHRLALLALKHRSRLVGEAVHRLGPQGFARPRFRHQ